MGEDRSPEGAGDESPRVEERQISVAKRREEPGEAYGGHERPEAILRSAPPGEEAGADEAPPDDHDVHGLELASRWRGV